MAYNPLYKLQDNITAIRIALDGGKPGSDELASLEKYSGFGGIKAILYPHGSADEWYNLGAASADRGGKLSIIDFEMAYSVNRGTPTPPYIMGTPGFASPEQMNYEIPTYAEDTYSLGAFLLFMVTATPPAIIADPLDKLEERIGDLAGDDRIKAIVLQCMSADPLLRPSIAELRKDIIGILSDYYNSDN